MILLIGFAVILIIALLAWLVGRNSGSHGENQSGGTNLSAPTTPPAPTRPVDDGTGTPPGPDSPDA